MPRTWNIVEAEDNVSNKFPPRKRFIPCKACKHFTRYMSVFLILSNNVFVQALRKIRRRLFGTDKKWPSTLNCRLVVYSMIGSVQLISGLVW